MGPFEGVKDLAGITKHAQQPQKSQQEQAGHKPGVVGKMTGSSPRGSA